MLYKRFKDAFRISEVWAYLGIIFAAIVIITINIGSLYDSLGIAVRDAAFSVGSVITTTGFATADFNNWPEFSRMILLLLMFIGACAGSTGGGMKVSRIMLMCKTLLNELRLETHPKQVKKIKMDGQVISHETIRAMNNYLIVYLLIFAASVLLLSIEGHDFLTNFSTVAATLNNIGPGLSLVGPSGNFAFYSDFSKIIITFDMIAGRLELFPMLVLFSPTTWKK